MCVYTCVCMHTCVCAHMCVWVCAHVRVSSRVQVSMYACHSTHVDVRGWLLGRGFLLPCGFWDFCRLGHKHLCLWTISSICLCLYLEMFMAVSGLKSYFSLWMSSFPGAICQRDCLLSFLSCMFWYFCQKLGLWCRVGLCLGPWSNWSVCLCVLSSYRLLLTSECSLELRAVVAQLFSSLRIALASSGLSCFSIQLGMFSDSVGNYHEYLWRAFVLWIFS